MCGQPRLPGCHDLYIWRADRSDAATSTIYMPLASRRACKAGVLTLEAGPSRFADKQVLGACNEDWVWIWHGSASVCSKGHLGYPAAWLHGKAGLVQLQGILVLVQAELGTCSPQVSLATAWVPLQRMPACMAA